jgi:hypothetical protein
MRKVASRIALIESLALAIYALSLLISASINGTTVGSPIVETFIYLIFSTLIFFVARGFIRAQSWSRTPYLLAQIFIGIVAYTLISGTETGYKLAGILIGVTALTGLAAMFKTPVEN